MSTKHAWRFFRAGGFDQVRLDSGADLAAIDQLDQKLWVALACPTTGLEFDGRTLALIDTDHDGRIRAPEIIAATQWAVGCLKNPDDLLKGLPSLPLSAINDATPEGKQLLASARHVLASLGKETADGITIEDTADTAKIFAQINFNGDGIVPADAATDPGVKAVINDIIACVGAEADRSGKPGVSQAKVDLFFTDAQAYSDWARKAEADRSLLPLEGATATALATLNHLKPKIDDYFMRCRLASFDARALSALNREEKEYAALAVKDLTASSAEIAALPLAQVGAGRPLPLQDGLNPAWSAAMSQLETQIVRPLLNGKNVISESDWTAISDKFAPYEAWFANKAGATVEKLGLPRVREILDGNSRQEITALVAKDKALEPESNAIANVERLVRYHRDVFKLLNNFVCFRDFYSRRDKAIFQAGTLYLDQRSCDLCLTVEDAGRHALMAGLAGAYLAYCDCVRKATGEKIQIVAAFTGGDSDNLMVGRNGLFYDRRGRDWDATISKVIENPISIRQAFFGPYKKFVRMIEEQIAKRAAAADSAASAQLQAAASALAQGAPVPAGVPPPASKFDVGVIAALGVAFGAIGTFLATILAKLIDLAPWQIVLVLVAIVLLISGPSMLIAFLKLRKRNLGPILDANGWAVNAKARLNVPFGASLTAVASLPPGSQRDLFDPFAEKKSPWPKLIVIALILWLVYAALNHMGYVFEWTNGRLGQPRPARTKPAAGAATPSAPPSKPAEAK